MSADRKPVPVTRGITRGDRGADVRRLQVALNLEIKRGVLPRAKGQIQVDGIAGPQTFRAVARVGWFLGFPLRPLRAAKQGRITKGVQRSIRNRNRRGNLMAERAKRRNAVAIGDTDRMSKDFHIREFYTKDGTPVPDYSREALRNLCSQVLQPVRDQYGPAYVTSGYRHAAYNANIGGASRSLHIYEMHRNAVAADVVFQRGTPAQWGAVGRARGASGVGVYPRSGFTHFDNRARVGMATSHWQQ